MYLDGHLAVESFRYQFLIIRLCLLDIHAFTAYSINGGFYYTLEVLLSEAWRGEKCNCLSNEVAGASLQETLYQPCRARFIVIDSPSPLQKCPTDGWKSHAGLFLNNAHPQVVWWASKGVMASADAEDYYGVLELSRDASESDIRRNFQRLVRKVTLQWDIIIDLNLLWSVVPSW